MESITEKLQRLQRQYSQQLPDRIRQLEEKWQCVIDQSDQQAFNSLLHEAHHLAGSGEIYGYRQISKAARELEQILADIMKLQRPPNTDEQVCIEDYIHALYLAAQSPEQKITQL